MNRLYYYIGKSEIVKHFLKNRGISIDKKTARTLYYLLTVFHKIDVGEETGHEQKRPVGPLCPQRGGAGAAGPGDGQAGAGPEPGRARPHALPLPRGAGGGGGPAAAVRTDQKFVLGRLPRRRAGRLRLSPRLAGGGGRDGRPGGSGGGGGGDLPHKRRPGPPGRAGGPDGPGYHPGEAGGHPVPREGPLPGGRPAGGPAHPPVPVGGGRAVENLRGGDPGA